MQKPIFDVILTKQEWDVLKALHAMGVPASAPAVHRRFLLGVFSLPTVYKTLRNFVQCKLVNVTRPTIVVPKNGPARIFIWEVSEDGKVFFS
jgi:hypothetical protein